MTWTLIKTIIDANAVIIPVWNVMQYSSVKSSVFGTVFQKTHLCQERWKFFFLVDGLSKNVGHHGWSLRKVCQITG